MTKDDSMVVLSEQPCIHVHVNNIIQIAVLHITVLNMDVMSQAWIALAY